MSIIDSVERQRAELEVNRLKLEQALRHWQTWDAEYEELKEELQSLPSAADPSEIATVAANFHGELLNDNEIQQLTGTTTANPRSVPYIVNLIEKRQEYVQQNIHTITKQRSSLETDFERLEDDERSSVAVPDGRLPLSEIIEELDDDDNVISSRVTRPEESTVGIIDSLRKAGIAQASNEADTSAQATPDAPSALGAASSAKLERKTAGNAQVSSTQRLQSSLHKAQTGQVEPTGVSKELTAGSFSSKDRVIELDDEDALLSASAVLPEDDSPEDAKLRRDMLRYHLNEVGNVVAEMDILEGGSDEDFEDDLEGMEGSDDYGSDASGISEDEDEHGRSRRTVISDAYKKQMQDLEARLNAHGLQNLGPHPAIADQMTLATSQPVVMERIKETNQAPTAGRRKSVRFADDVDISPDIAKRQRAEPARPVVDAVMERTSSTTASNGPPNQDSLASQSSSKASRFKQTLQDKNAPQSDRVAVPKTSGAPLAREDPILANSVVEREGTSNDGTFKDVDEFDPELQKRQLASRYYEMRNDIVQQQGGFKADEVDDGQGPLMEETEDGRVKKVSRFKAARMKF